MRPPAARNNAMAAPLPATVLVHEPPANTARGSVLALINSTVGAGVLSFPYAFRQTGWAAGLACTVAIAGEWLGAAS